MPQNQRFPAPPAIPAATNVAEGDLPPVAEPAVPPAASESASADAHIPIATPIDPQPTIPSADEPSADAALPADEEPTVPTATALDEVPTAEPAQPEPAFATAPPTPPAHLTCPPWKRQRLMKHQQLKKPTKHPVAS